MNTPRVLFVGTLLGVRSSAHAPTAGRPTFASVLARAAVPRADGASHRRAWPEAAEREPASRDGMRMVTATTGPVGSGDAPTAAPDGARRVWVEDLLPRLVRKVAWSSNARGGCARLELGAGSLAGAVVLVQADELGVRVRLTAPPGVDLGPWRDRIAARLAAQGVDDDDVRIDAP